MKIVCTSCEAAYDVPDAVVRGRRRVRCARCGHDWVPADSMAPLEPAPPESEPRSEPRSEQRSEQRSEPRSEPRPEPQAQPAVPPPPPLPEPPRMQAIPSAEPVMPSLPASLGMPLAPDLPDDMDEDFEHPADRSPIIAWAASIGVLAVFVVALVVFKAPIMAAWPPITRLYGAVGLK